MIFSKWCMRISVLVDKRGLKSSIMWRASHLHHELLVFNFNVWFMSGCGYGDMLERNMVSVAQPVLNEKWNP